jgi:formylglycine-generating enzyme required for sulfatase activity
MKYRNISEYKEAILNAEANFSKLSNLRPVLDDNGTPIMIKGEVSVIFKMTDGEKNYAAKCFLTEQEGREDAYKQTCEYLDLVRLSYMVHTEYLENEMCVNTNHPENPKYPVVVMDWVEGMSLTQYMKVIRDDETKRIQLANEFRETMLSLLHEDFTHGDLNPENIMVTDKGQLKLVDYDDMLFPTMRSKETHKLGTSLYSDMYVDDYACVFLMLVMMVNSFSPTDFDAFTSTDVKGVLRHVSSYLEHPQVAPYISAFLLVASTGRLDRQVVWPLLAQPRLPRRLSQQSAAPQKNLSFTANGVTFEMVVIEGGTFTMGATQEQEEDAYDDEKPLHLVTLSKYAIGKHEVTQALWKAVMGDTPSRYKGDNLPVHNVSWDECLEFIKRLNSLTNKKFRFLTEAEWEFAARGGNMSKGYKYSGSNNPDEVAWHSGNSDGTPHDVGSKKPNELGIYDMSGNVSEWCKDWREYYPNWAVSNPAGPSYGTFRVVRGGSCRFDVESCRVSSRSTYDPFRGIPCIGLRLGLSKF